MLRKRFFKSSFGRFQMPLFFPDATRGFVKTVDMKDIEVTKTSGILVNTYHLYKNLGEDFIEKCKGIRNFIGWRGALISDSGGFQIMSLLKSPKGKGKVSDDGVLFIDSDNREIFFTPEDSVRLQLELKTDLVVVLDDFTPKDSSYIEAERSVQRTILWARRSKEEFLKICRKKRIKKNEMPYIVGVVQGGEYIDLRKKCTEELVRIGFDGLGYGGWPLDDQGSFNYEVAKTIAKYSPSDYLLYGLGVGKPDDIVKCFEIGYQIFDCVLPTRDARHERLYVFSSDSIDKIDINSDNFYSYFVPTKMIYSKDLSPVSKSCDCLLCKNYSRSYLYYLFKSNEVSALRLSTIHNLRFYSLLMEKIRENLGCF